LELFKFYRANIIIPNGNANTDRDEEQACEQDALALVTKGFFCVATGFYLLTLEFIVVVTTAQYNSDSIIKTHQLLGLKTKLCVLVRVWPL
jgi:hypothetical protein